MEFIEIGTEAKWLAINTKSNGDTWRPVASTWSKEPAATFSNIGRMAE
jgi:hypothetical protein